MLTNFSVDDHKPPVKNPNDILVGCSQIDLKPLWENCWLHSGSTHCKWDTRSLCKFDTSTWHNVLKSIPDETCFHLQRFQQAFSKNKISIYQFPPLRTKKTLIPAKFQWSFLVPLIGGRYHIIPQLAVYKWYISGIYCQLGDYMVPTTY